MSDDANRTALVTGGAKRIGREICLTLARAGYDVAVHYNTSAGPAGALADEIRGLGRRAETFRCDLADLPALDGLIGAVLDTMDGCDVLVNNASIFPRGEFHETDVALLDEVLAVNFKAPFLLIQAFARRSGRGCVVNLLDSRIDRGFTHYFAYSLSKKLLAELTRMTALALAPDVRVNGVCPGLILPAEGQSREDFERMGRELPSGSVGGPEDVARAVLYFADNAFVTGETLFVDGGEHLRD